MRPIPLTLGRLEPAGPPLRRSGLRWLCDDGHPCRANEIVAYCNLSFAGQTDAFPEEGFDLQVALAPRMAGVIRRVASPSPGGMLDRVPNMPWSPQTVWAHLEPRPGDGDGPPEEPNLLFLAGRRLTDIAEDRSGLLTGWHSRKRAWWGEGEGGGLLVPATCNQTGLIRGDDGSFGGLFERLAGPAHVVMTQGEPVVSCAAVFNERLSRTPQDGRAIREDMARSFLDGGGVLPTAGWLFMGALQKGLDPAQLDERYDLLTRAGLRRSQPVSAICLSLETEPRHLLRHRRLGYALNLHTYRLAWVGEAVRDWLQRDFDVEPQSVEDVARDYHRLVETAPDRTFVFVNQICSQANEAIQDYEAFDEAMMAQLGGVRAAELNLMLHDLARAPNVQIVDADAIAADLGIARHLPDAAHATGELQRELQAELLHCLQAQGVAGFVPRSQPMLNSAGQESPSPPRGSSASSLSTASTPPSGHHSPSP